MMSETDTPIETLLQRLALLERRELEREREAEVAKRVAKAWLEREKADQAHGLDPDLRRSAMTPLQKSQYIRQHTKQRYDEIPW